MREIQFRGKRLDNGQWVYGYLAFIYTAGRDEKGLILTNKACIYSPEDVANFDVDASTVSQYTGIKDKDGKEIYEDDIVAVSYGISGLDSTGIIKYRMGGFILWLPTGGYLSPIDFCGTNAQITGNIHDNQELME